MKNHELLLPEDFGDYAWELEAKGWFPGAVLLYLDRRYSLMFYDPGRLKQTIEDDLQGRPVIIEKNLLVVASVTEAAMRQAVAYAVENGLVSNMIAD